MCVLFGEVVLIAVAERGGSFAEFGFIVVEDGGSK